MFAEVGGAREGVRGKDIDLRQLLYSFVPSPLAPKSTVLPPFAQITKAKPYTYHLRLLQYNMRSTDYRIMGRAVKAA